MCFGSSVQGDGNNKHPLTSEVCKKKKAKKINPKNLLLGDKETGLSGGCNKEHGSLG